MAVMRRPVAELRRVGRAHCAERGVRAEHGRVRGNVNAPLARNVEVDDLALVVLHISVRKRVGYGRVQKRISLRGVMIELRVSGNIM